MKTAQLLVDARGPEIRHRAGITAPDSFIYLRIPGEGDIVFFDGREYDVQKKHLDELQSSIVIERLEPYVDKARAMPGDLPIDRKILLSVLKEKGITSVEVSATLHYGLADALLQNGITLTIGDFSGERLRKK